MNPREEAVIILQQVLDNKRSLTQVFNTHFQGKEVRSQSLIKEMCYGVLRFYSKLDAIANRLLAKKLKKKDEDIHFLILLGLYQLLEMRVADYAVVKETVNVTLLLKKAWAKDLVNAVLRNFQRKKETLLKDIQQEAVAYYAHPAWMLCVFSEDWPQDWVSIVENNNIKPPLTIRVNLKKVTREVYLAELIEKGWEARPHAWMSSAILILSNVEVMQLPGFAEGKVSVQDASAQFAGTLLELSPHQRVLDMCAAPGGKTMHLLEQEDSIALFAIDQDASRLLRVEENLKRANLQATLICADASKQETWWDKRYFDRVLLDGPCTATGVIRRHPDIKWLRQQEDVEKIVTLQRQLLHTAWTVLKEGGILIYCTCSILKCENVDQIREFLSSHQDAEEIKIDAVGGVEVSIGKQILPSFENDGFYYVKLRKKRSDLF
ncbi:MAG: 16S rRNA (cytosine(967)-C(5))-methyltransferase RsmB [Gammaproteobacteria bacterium]|nr:16S rRNA (cytosine(967)-C(5))-methyltransferase RsmB [Gammaproteobacteria bacterium]